MPDTHIEAAPPVAKAVPSSATLHGELRSDDYAWLRDRENPDVIAYLEAENAYTAAEMRHTEPLQKTLFDEMLARIKEDDTDVPVRRDGWLYYSRTEQGKAYPIYCRRRDIAESPEEVIFDQNAAAAGHAFYQLGGFEVSPDHNYLALLVDTNGYEDFVLRVKDLRTGEFLGDTADALGFGLAWASDGHTLFYQTTDAAKRGDRVWRHRLGEPRSSDVAVYHDPDPLFNVGVRRSRSGEFVVLTSSSFTSGESWLLDARAPESAPRIVAPRTADVEYDVDDGGGWLYLLTNRDGARDFKVMRAAVSSPGAWSEWLPARPGVFVEGVDVFRDYVVVQEREGGLRRLRVTAVADGGSHLVEFPEAAYGVVVEENPEFATRTLRFTYSSLITPDSVYDYDMGARTRELRKRDEVLGGYDPSQYRVERLMAPARDGSAVPVSLVYRTPFARDGARPLVLYAYGAYGHIIEPTFSSARLSLLDRGFVYAIAHVRGGEDMGRAWYDEGKMFGKMNTFLDFIDGAEFLVRERYTSSDRLVAHGGSAGGLLMGAIANLRGELFHAIVADVPFVDVINTMLDASIPLTAQEWEQWGNPADAAAYAYMRTYSPYDNVRHGSYPRMLVTSGVNDSRVAFWEPAKWVARLRANKTDANPLLLKMNMGAGHGGATGRYERLKEIAFRYAFMIDQATPKA
ncbi:MAG: S9 family peptidase [Gemmatimonadaceae bacterium]